MVTNHAWGHSGGSAYFATTQIEPISAIYVYISKETLQGWWLIMRRLYLLEENEEDGRVLDALQTRGEDPDEHVNPQCPLCGSDTLVAYSRAHEYCVITDECLTEIDLEPRPDAWYLICQDFLCRYEEQVEWVNDPVDADIFDLLQSSLGFDDYSGLTSRAPHDMKELINYFRLVTKTHPHPKLGTYLEEAEWRYEWGMREVQAWIQRIPAGRTITFYLGSDRIKATFVTATEEMLLVQTVPDGEMMAVDAGAIYHYGPQHFDSDEDPVDIDPRDLDPDHWVSCGGSSEYIVVRGYHLHLGLVDRFGQYHVWTSDPEAASVLGLKPQGKESWTGRLRRSDIEARYKKRRMIKVKGHWVEVHGETARSKSPSVHTEDPETAAALGLRLNERLRSDEETPADGQQIPRWSGVIPRDQVEAWDEVTLNQWPIPEVKDLPAEGEQGDT